MFCIRYCDGTKAVQIQFSSWITCSGETKYSSVVTRWTTHIRGCQWNVHGLWVSGGTLSRALHRPLRPKEPSQKAGRGGSMVFIDVMKKKGDPDDKDCSDSCFGFQGVTPFSKCLCHISHMKQLSFSGERLVSACTALRSQHSLS